jgi:hypothetical protein
MAFLPSGSHGCAGLPWTRCRTLAGGVVSNTSQPFAGAEGFPAASTAVASTERLPSTADDRLPQYTPPLRNNEQTQAHTRTHNNRSAICKGAMRGVNSCSAISLTCVPSGAPQQHHPPTRPQSRETCPQPRCTTARSHCESSGESSWPLTHRAAQQQEAPCPQW